VKSVPLGGELALAGVTWGPDVTIHTLYTVLRASMWWCASCVCGPDRVHLLFIQRQGMAPPLGAKTPARMKFFPSFALRDVLLGCSASRCFLPWAVFIPYGPGDTRHGVELGKKATRSLRPTRASNPSGIFFWTYQLLKEFPPHLFGLEGPQICLLVVSLLLGIWAIIPWLDRQAQRDRPSPWLSDFGWAAILFLTS